MLNADTLKSTINKRGGMASSNKFLVIIPFVNFNLNLNKLVLKGNPISDVNFRDLGILCETMTFPGRQVATIDHTTNIKPVKKPNGFINNDITATFNLTNDYYIKRIFDAWFDMIINDQYEISYKTDYARDLYVIKLNDRGVPIYQMRVKNAYPIQVQDIENNAASRNELQKLSVTFTYDDYDTYDLDLNSILSSSVTDLVTNGAELKGLLDVGINNIKSVL